MRLEKVDIAIIGGGPAGLSLAKNLAENKVSFTLIEEDKDFFMKACGEGLPKRVKGYDVLELYGSKVGIENEIETATVYLNSKPIKTSANDSYTIDKRRFEKEMYMQAKRHGGDLRLGQRAISFERTSDGILIKPQNIVCKCLVGCDGTLSKVRDFFGEKVNEKLFAVAAYKPKKEKDTDLKIHVGAKTIPGGYVWEFPKTDFYNVGVGSVNKDVVMESYKRMFDSKDVRGAFIPFSLPCKSYFKNGMLIGDSGSQINALSGGGIDHSLVIAMMASEVLTKISKTGKNFSEENLKRYESRWRKELYLSMLRSYISAKIAISGPVQSNDTILKMLVKLFG